ncbi:MAG: transposase [Methylococcales bacterium]|nr:transposase [Methylococcales bacterium]
MSDNTDTPDISELSVEEIDALIGRLEEAIEFDLALSKSDIRLLINAVLTLASMQERLQDKDITLHKLRKLLGMVKSSERLNDLLKDINADVNKNKKPRQKKPRKKRTFIPPKVHHSLDDLKKGDACPACQQGKLYKYEPAQLLRITGHTPFTPEMHLSERLRCNTCGEFFTAPLSDEVAADGGSDQMYGYSARSLMAINKYFSGNPFYRQESLQDILGFHISASTIFDQTEYFANDFQPIFNAMKALAADAGHFYLDDTPHHILEQQPIQKKKRNSEKMQTRTGLYASGIIATHESHDIILFQTNIGHAGEFIDELLANRQPELPPPILMGDALSSNNPTVLSVHRGACNSHGRRQYVDVLAHFPEEVEQVLELYKIIWINEDETINQSMTSADRLAYHQKKSLPIMEKIRTWGKQHFIDETVEENSGLGKAIAYFERHFDSLSLFCKIENAKIDNNKMEAMLKLIARNRKNAYFYKTLAGAAISDVITSGIATTMQTEANLFDYFNAIQHNRLAVKSNPMAWMPWNYMGNFKD